MVGISASLTSEGNSGHWAMYFVVGIMIFRFLVGMYEAWFQVEDGSCLDVMVDEDCLPSADAEC